MKNLFLFVALALMCLMIVFSSFAQDKCFTIEDGQTWLDKRIPHISEIRDDPKDENVKLFYYYFISAKDLKAGTEGYVPMKHVLVTPFIDGCGTDSIITGVTPDIFFGDERWNDFKLRLEKEMNDVKKEETF